MPETCVICKKTNKHENFISLIPCDCEDNDKFYHRSCLNKQKLKGPTCPECKKDYFLNGVRTLYHPDGSIRMKATYVNGLAEGLCTWYSNHPIISCNYINDKRQGPATFYNTDGSLSGTLNHVDDLYEGTYVQKDKDGVIVQEKTYSRGKLNGIHKEYMNGKLWREIPYVDDKKEGICNIYDTINEKLIQEISYLNNKSHGPSNYYSRKTGKLTRTVIYENGKIKK